MKPRIVILAIVALGALLQAAMSIGQAKVNSRPAGLITSGITTQAANPPYLREMPSAERVKAEIKGTDAMDTAARQMGAFWQLQQIIKELSGLRWTRNELTSDEKRLLGEYGGGYQSAGQPYVSYPDRPKWYKLHSFYEVDDAFREELFKRFFSPEFRAQYLRTKGDTEATVKARREARAQALKEEQEQIARAQAEAQATFGHTVSAQSKPRSAPRSPQKLTYETATTKSGRTVILKSDGTWVYEDEGTPPRKSNPGGSTSPTEPPASNEIVQSTLAEVTSDEFGFIGKTVLIKSVTIKISPYYWCKSKSIEATHYAFVVQEYRSLYDIPTANVYMKRSEKARELRNRLLNRPAIFDLRVSIVIKVLKDRENCALELIDYSLQ